jgi:hypothetical protein
VYSAEDVIKVLEPIYESKIRFGIPCTIKFTYPLQGNGSNDITFTFQLHYFSDATQKFELISIFAVDAKNVKSPRDVLTQQATFQPLPQIGDSTKVLILILGNELKGFSNVFYLQPQQTGSGGNWTFIFLVLGGGLTMIAMGLLGAWQMKKRMSGGRVEMTMDELEENMGMPDPEHPQSNHHDSVEGGTFVDDADMQYGNLQDDDIDQGDQDEYKENKE